MAVPPLTFDDALDALRRKMRVLRQTRANQGNWQPAPLDSRLADLMAQSDSIGYYAPMGGEPDPTAIPYGTSKVTSRPALDPDGKMVFRRWAVGDEQVASSWGGTQPPDTAPIVKPDLILVPLVAFDTQLNRLGQGGGHYDRYLANHSKALRVGVAWEAQRTPVLPVRLWDVPLHAVITEERCYIKDLHDA
jgi:5-formyltetrahydrofolate cyclo-ligase